jgi:hypothetical protein
MSQILQTRMTPWRGMRRWMPEGLKMKTARLKSALGRCAFRPEHRACLSALAIVHRVGGTAFSEGTLIRHSLPFLTINNTTTVALVVLVLKHSVADAQCQILFLHRNGAPFSRLKERECRRAQSPTPSAESSGRERRAVGTAKSEK